MWAREKLGIKLHIAHESKNPIRFRGRSGNVSVRKEEIKRKGKKSKTRKKTQDTMN